MKQQYILGLALIKLMKILGNKSSMRRHYKILMHSNPLRLVSVLFLFLASIMCTSTGNAQSRLGHSKSQILEEFAQFNPVFEIKENGDSVIHFTMDRAVVFQYINGEGFCNMSIIVPRDRDNLNYYVQKYNEQYVVLNDRNWKMYSENGTIAAIELVHHEGLAFFVWK